MTRTVRLSFMCATAALVACGRSPVRMAIPDPASGAAGGAATPTAGARAEAMAGRALAAGTGQQAAQSAPDQEAPASRMPAIAIPAVGPAVGSAGDPAGQVASEANAAANAPADGGHALDVSEAASRLAPDSEFDESTLAAAVRKALGDPPPAIVRGGGADLGAASTADGTGRRKRKGAGTLNALGFFWGSPDVANRVYGNLGWSYADLWWDDFYGTINGTLDGRSVYLTDDVDSLHGWIGSSPVELRRHSSWWSSDKIRGYLGGHPIDIAVGNGSVKGYEGSTYLNTYTSWDGRSLKGSYGIYKVNVYSSGGTLTGSIGYRGVKITSGWSARYGYIGNKAVYLQGDLSNSALLRRMPLLAANDWMIISTLTEFFD